jgi:myo-inositol-1(or 4)-monophosphatase
MEEFMKDTALKAGEIALSYRNRSSSLQFERKETVKDLVTEADQAVEEYIRKAIEKRFPGHAVTGEEMGATGDHEYRWVVDPIDGTISFYHGQYFFSVSIALTYKGEVLMGAVYAPALDDLYSAVKGKGAVLNGKGIHVSSSHALIDSVASTGFCCLRDGYETNSLELFGKMLPLLRDFRRSGSAALDLCSVACGRLDAYWERCLNLYDVAAGMIILKEAGGTISDYRGSQDGIPGEILATNGKIHQAMAGVLSGWQ